MVEQIKKCCKRNNMGMQKTKSIYKGFHISELCYRKIKAFTKKSLVIKGIHNHLL